jgi:hypothetical protein
MISKPGLLKGTKHDQSTLILKKYDINFQRSSLSVKQDNDDLCSCLIFGMQILIYNHSYHD